MVGVFGLKAQMDKEIIFASPFPKQMCDRKLFRRRLRQIQSSCRGFEIETAENIKRGQQGGLPKKDIRRLGGFR